MYKNQNRKQKWKSQKDPREGSGRHLKHNLTERQREDKTIHRGWRTRHRWK